MINTYQFSQTALGLYLRETWLHYRSMMVQPPDDMPLENIAKVTREKNASRWRSFERALIELCVDKAAADVRANNTFKGHAAVRLSIKLQIFGSYTIKHPSFSTLKQEGSPGFNRLFAMAAAEGLVAHSMKFDKGIVTAPIVPAKFTLMFSKEKPPAAREPDEILPPPGKNKGPYARPSGPTSTIHVRV